MTRVTHARVADVPADDLAWAVPGAAGGGGTARGPGRGRSLHHHDSRRRAVARAGRDPLRPPPPDAAAGLWQQPVGAAGWRRRRCSCRFTTALAEAPRWRRRRSPCSPRGAVQPGRRPRRRRRHLQGERAEEALDRLLAADPATATAATLVAGVAAGQRGVRAMYTDTYTGTTAAHPSVSQPRRRRQFFFFVLHTSTVFTSKAVTVPHHTTSLIPIIRFHQSKPQSSSLLRSAHPSEQW